MARNIKPSDDNTTTAEDALPPGGAPGVAQDDPNTAASSVGGAKVAPAQITNAPREAQAPKRFRVTGGPGHADSNGGYRAMYDGALTTVRLGRVFNEHQTDLDHLRKQGFKFEAVAE